MHVQSVSVRFGLILEAYCRGTLEHMSQLSRQLDCLEKLKKSSQLVRKRRDKDKARSTLKEFISEKHNLVSNIRSPLDPSFNCTKIL